MVFFWPYAYDKANVWTRPRKTGAAPTCRVHSAHTVHVRIGCPFNGNEFFGGLRFDESGAFWFYLMVVDRAAAPVSRHGSSVPFSKPGLVQIDRATARAAAIIG